MKKQSLKVSSKFFAEDMKKSLALKMEKKVWVESAEKGLVIEISQ